MLVSILALTRVMLEVTRHRCAMPSCITMAIRSACWAGSQAWSVESETVTLINQWSQSLHKSSNQAKDPQTLSQYNECSFNMPLLLLYYYRQEGVRGFCLMSLKIKTARNPCQNHIYLKKKKEEFVELHNR